MPVRAEVALAYEKNDMDKLTISGFGSTSANEDVELITVMANGYYDINTDTPLTPYVLAGLGWLHVDVGGDTGDHIAGQFGAGVGYEVTEGVVLDLKYKYLMSIGDVDVEGVDVAVAGHTIQIGARFTF